MHHVLLLSYVAPSPPPPGGGGRSLCFCLLGGNSPLIRKGHVGPDTLSNVSLITECNTAGKELRLLARGLSGNGAGCGRCRQNLGASTRGCYGVFGAGWVLAQPQQDRRGGIKTGVGKAYGWGLHQSRSYDPRRPTLVTSHSPGSWEDKAMTRPVQKLG